MVSDNLFILPQCNLERHKPSSTRWLQRARSNMPRCKRHKIPTLPANTVPRKPVTKTERAEACRLLLPPTAAKWSAANQTRGVSNALTAHKPVRKFQTKTSSVVSLQLNPHAPLRPRITPESAITAFFFPSSSFFDTSSAERKPSLTQDGCSQKSQDQASH